MFGILSGQMFHLNVSYLERTPWKCEHLILIIHLRGVFGQDSFRIFRIKLKSQRLLHLLWDSCSGLYLVTCVSLTHEHFYQCCHHYQCWWSLYPRPFQANLLEKNTPMVHRLVVSVVGPLFPSHLSNSEVFQSYGCPVWASVPLQLKQWHAPSLHT